jgi:hypothetical protein
MVPRAERQMRSGTTKAGIGAIGALLLCIALGGCANGLRISSDRSLATIVRKYAASDAPTRLQTLSVVSSKDAHAFFGVHGEVVFNKGETATNQLFCEALFAGLLRTSVADQVSLPLLTGSLPDGRSFVGYNETLIYDTRKQSEIDRAPHNGIHEECTSVLSNSYDYERAHEIIGILNLTERRGPFLLAFDPTQDNKMTGLDVSRYVEKDFLVAIGKWKRLLASNPTGWNEGVLEGPDILYQMGKFMNTIAEPFTRLFGKK